MQTKLNVGLVLSVIITPTLTLFATTSTKAQYDYRYYDRDPHYYCDGLARDRTARFAERDDLGTAVSDAAINGT